MGGMKRYLYTITRRMADNSLAAYRRLSVKHPVMAELVLVEFNFWNAIGNGLARRIL